MRSLKIIFAVAVFITVLLIFSGCTDDTPKNSQPPVDAAKPKYITLVSDKVNEVNLGDMLQIIIEENHTTQYRWYFDISGDDILEVVSDDFSWDANNNDADGGGGKRTITFLSTAPGEATVEMSLMIERPEPLDDNYEDVVSQTVNYKIAVE